MAYDGTRRIACCGCDELYTGPRITTEKSYKRRDCEASATLLRRCVVAEKAPGTSSKALESFVKIPDMKIGSACTCYQDFSFLSNS